MKRLRVLFLAAGGFENEWNMYGNANFDVFFHSRY